MRACVRARVCLLMVHIHERTQIKMTANLIRLHINAEMAIARALSVLQIRMFSYVSVGELTRSARPVWRKSF